MAAQYGERLLSSPANPISLGVTLDQWLPMAGARVCAAAARLCAFAGQCGQHSESEARASLARSSARSLACALARILEIRRFR